MTEYCAYLSPPQLFVGTTFHEEFWGEEEFIDEHWEQEPQQISREKLINGIESLGIKCIDIQFGDYIPSEGVLEVKSILCECPKDKELLNTLLTDEVYITTGISCYSDDTVSPMVAFYFKRSI